MIKNVTQGAKTTTITLSQGETAEIIFSKAYYYYYIRNFSDNIVYANVFKVPVPEGDGTVAILPNDFGTTFHEDYIEKLFLICNTGDAKVEITGTNNKNINY